MALIECSECGKEVSEKASACPHCGAPVSAPLARASDEPTQQATSRAHRIADVDGPKVQGKKSGAILNSLSGKLRVRNGIVEIKGLVVATDLGRLDDLTSVIFRDKKRRKASLRFAGSSYDVESKTELEGFVHKLHSATGGAFDISVEAEGLTLSKLAQGAVSVVVLLAILGWIFGNHKTGGSGPSTATTSHGRTLYIQEPVANVRSGPGTANSIVAKLEWATPLEELDVQGAWHEVRFNRGANAGTAWVAGSVIGTKQPPKLIAEGCRSVVSQFELASNLSDVQKDKIWAERYEGKAVRWTMYVDNVDAQTFGGGFTVYYGCTNDPYRMGADVHVDYPESFKESLLKANKGTAFKETIVLRSRVGGTLFGDRLH